MKTIKMTALGVAALLVGLDQMIKLWAVRVLGPARQIKVIPGLFNLTYVENRGAAFGILQGNTFFLSIVTGAVLLAALVILLSNRVTEKYLIWTVSLILAGGTGNLLDRLFRGFVVDYLDFSSLFGFPVFNLADCCVVIGTFMLLFYVIRQDYRDRKDKQSSTGENEA